MHGGVSFVLPVTPGDVRIVDDVSEDEDRRPRSNRSRKDDHDDPCHSRSQSQSPGRARAGDLRQENARGDRRADSGAREEAGRRVRTTQSNHEGVIIDLIQTAAGDGISAIVLNPGAYSHTSVAIADAIRSVKTPVVEVHLTNLYARGGDRAKSVTATAAKGTVMGFGAESYLLGVEAAVRVEKPSRPAKRRRSRSR